VRGRDDTLRAFYNVCRHKGRQVVTGEGVAKQLVCGYHAWRYDLDGRLRSAPRMAGIEDFAREKINLVPMALANWGPWLFINQDHDAPPVAALAPEVDAALDESGYRKLRYAGRRSWTLACNWKVYVDNFLDGGYHVPHMHPTLAAGLDMASYRTEVFARSSIQSSAAAQVERHGEDASIERIGRRVIYAWIYPNFMVNRYGPCLDSNHVVPLGPERCRVDYEFYFDGDAIGHGEAAQAFVERSMAQSEVTQREDIAICESVQLGLSSSSYDRGRYAPTVEQGEHHFHGLLAADYRHALAMFSRRKAVIEATVSSMCIFLLVLLCSTLIACSSAPDTTAAGSGGSGGQSASAGPGPGGAGGSSSSAGGGGATSCTPGQVEDCYGGPDGTEGVGVCSAGSRTCLPSGKGFSDCDSEVTPGIEDCSTDADEDCSGHSCLETEWAVLLGDAGFNYGSHIDVTPNGEYAVAGSFMGSVDLGGDHKYTTLGGHDILLARFDKTGKTTWSKRIGTIGNDVAGGMAVAADGSVYVGGYVPVATQFGNTSLGIGPFAAKLDSNGDFVWAKRLSTGSFGRVNRVRITPANTLIVCGKVNLNLLGSQVGYAGQVDGFALQLDITAGAQLTRLLFGGPLDDAVHDCVADADGAIYMTGSFTNSLNLPTEGIMAFGGEDVFTFKYDALNAVVAWVKTAGDPQSQRGESLSIDAATGDVLVTGYAEGTVNFGGSELIANDSQGNMFVVRYAKTGGHVASATFGSAASRQNGRGIRSLADGGTLVAGSTSGVTNLGGGILGTGSGGDAVVLRLDKDLVHVASRSFGSIGLDRFFDLIVDADGKAVVVGDAGDGIDFGLGPIMGSGGTDMIIARLTP
jgi:phenylpropionate dioxygenase-like ring-hydroxylating dioxygenase large terminal subunit